MYRQFVLCHYVHCFLVPPPHCQYLTLCRLWVLCHYALCCLLQSVHCLSVPRTLPSIDSVSLCPLMSSIFNPLSFSTLHLTVSLFCVSISTAVFYSLSIVCQYLTLYRLLVLFHYIHFCLLQTTHFLSIPHTAIAVTRRLMVLLQ